MIQFPQLRVRTGFSFKKAYGHLDDVTERLQAVNAGSAGIVDAGTWGHVKYEEAMKKAGLVPMFGAELPIVTEGSDFKPRAWVLAKDTRRLYNITSLAERNGGVCAHELGTEEGSAEGLITFVGGAIHCKPYHFDFVDINPASITHAYKAVQYARRFNMPMVLTSYNDMPDFKHEAEALAWEVRDAVGPRVISDVDALREYLVTNVHVLNGSEFDRAVERTQWVAEQLKDVKLQKAPLISLEGDMVAEAREGMRERLALGHIREWTDEYEERFNSEVEIIRVKAFDSYFLCVADLIKFAKKHMLVGPARGSSAGSLICYLLRITEVDPIKYGLLFYRFIDISRADFPDIDIDFADTKRYMVFDYLKEKYGEQNVSKLGNVNFLKGLSTLEKVRQKFALPFSATDQVKSSLVSDYPEGDPRYGYAVQDTLTQTEAGRDFARRFESAALCASAIEIHPSHSGVHAAGIIVCNEAISDFVTVTADGIAQVDKRDAEKLNLLKIDALGLRTLGVIEDSHVVTADELYALEPTDPACYALLDSDKVGGLFQFEGDAVRSITRQMHIDRFDQIDHITSLARPGPMSSGMANTYIRRANGKEPVSYDIPQLKAILEPTHGVIVYQEQIMSIVKDIAGFDWEQTSSIRRAMGKKMGDEYFNKKLAEFVDGCAKTCGVGADAATKIWQQMRTFGSYGFNRCISGDTRVRLAHSNQSVGNTPTIAQLYDMYIRNPGPALKQKMKRQKCMPVLLCLNEEEGKAYPVMAENIHSNGVKPCVKMKFSDGSEVVCTPDHKFLIDGEWKRCEESRIGSVFTTIQNANGKVPSSDRALLPGSKAWAKGMKWVDGKRMELNGKTREEDSFKAAKRGKPCEDCGEKKCHMEAHHNDFDAGRIRPDDFSWLCAGCHKKRHYANGDRKKAYGRGQPIGTPLVLISVEDAGEVETFDIEMPDPWHNFELANGLVTHNSHSVSYGLVTYWTLYMKVYHRLEYAAASLRAAKDDEQVYAILRELAAEGVPYTPMDPDYSETNWMVANGRLVGGIQNAKGYGPVTALKYIEKRRLGLITEKDRAKLAKAEVKFSDISEARTRWGFAYDNPPAVGVTSGNPIVQIKDVTGNDDCLIIVKLRKKVLEDENDPARQKRRVEDGKPAKFRGPSQFLDMLCVDDSVDSPVKVRIRPDLFVTLGKPIAQNDPVGSWYLVRAKRFFSVFIVKNILRLDDKEWRK